MKTAVIRPGTMILNLELTGEKCSIRADKTTMVHGLKCRHCALREIKDYCNKGYFVCSPIDREDGENLYFETVNMGPITGGLYWIRFNGRQDWIIAEYVPQWDFFVVKNGEDLIVRSEEVAETGEMVMSTQEAMRKVWQQ